MRSCGVLLHISSLPSDYGIGTLGKEAYRFVDFLKKGGHEYWQILPIGPTGYGDSPYQSYSAYAGNPLFIDLDMLADEGLLSKNDDDFKALAKKARKKAFANYEQLYACRKTVLFNAAKNFFSGDNSEKTEFDNFCRANEAWLSDYALFMSLKALFGNVIWTEWEDNARLRVNSSLEEYKNTLKEEMNAYKFIQYVFFKQYFTLKRYANSNGIKLFGDMPIYVSPDSADIWANPKLFMLGDDGKPVKVAGCPPDGFSPTGQLWGNPLYDWDAMAKDGYEWWVERVRYSETLFDLTRIDHFRGFESFYAIPAGNPTAEYGEWLKGPSMALFKAIKEKLGDVKLVAEDLGFLTPDVTAMLKEAGYPGMNVLEFAFGGDNSGYLPHNYVKNSVTYIGTHDNDTALGWYRSLDKETRIRVNRYIGINPSKGGIAERMFRIVYASVSELVILQMQDFLLQDSSSRMNTPSTVNDSNWTYRVKKEDISDRLADEMCKFADVYFRRNV
ncbi:MAG: 4-alpha-glucanotransferase [Oscillospiraceae bacterium]|nr:4-alpha-glucanotransferase [Oscillospiraceae bacterium]